MQLNERVIRMAGYLLLSRQAVRQRSLTPLFRRSESYLNSQRAQRALSPEQVLICGLNERDSRYSLFPNYKIT